GLREGQAHGDVRRRASGVRSRETGDGLVRTRGDAARPRGRWTAHEDGEPDLHRGPGAGPLGRHRLRREGGPRREPRARRDLEGRGAVVADGEPRQDDARAQVQLRLRGGLDAQGPRHLPRGGEAQRREAAGDAGRRRLLRRDLERRRQPLGYVVADHQTLTEVIMAMKLYYAQGACSLASHIALEEVGIPYETQPLNLAEGDQRKPEYLKLNPRGRVPTLVVDGHVLTATV